MKFIIVVSFLFALIYAKPFEEFYDSSLDYPFRDFYASMQCAPPQIDAYAMEYDCETEWNEYRDDYLASIQEFEDCTQIEDKNSADECQYKVFAYSENILKSFYVKLESTNQQCASIIPEVVRDNCQSDDLRYSPDF